MEKLYIPKRINVGFCNRTDTYTGKLGYIIYWDDKKVLRKEGSWEGWRDKKIDPVACDNEPVEGFILNRNVGGQRYSWSDGGREAKIRVFDPRGFEFEITLQNVLYILQECTSTKGKGLEGKFVYAWAGKDLILLPVDTYDYKLCTNFTDLQAKKIGKAEMTPGCSYTFKDTESYVYLGKYDYYQCDDFELPNPNYVKGTKRNYSYNYDKPITNTWDIGFFQHYIKTATKQHIFYKTDGNGKPYYRTEAGFTKIAVRDTEIPLSNLAELVVEYQSTQYGGKCVGLEVVDTELDFSFNNVNRQTNRLIDDYFIVMPDGKYRKVSITEEYEGRYSKDYSKFIPTTSRGFKKFEYLSSTAYWFENDMLCMKGVDYEYNHTNDEKTYMTLDKLMEYQYKNVYAILENGTKIKVNEYIH